MYKTMLKSDVRVNIQLSWYLLILVKSLFNLPIAKTNLKPIGSSWLVKYSEVSLWQQYVQHRVTPGRSDILIPPILSKNAKFSNQFFVNKFLCISILNSRNVTLNQYLKYSEKQTCIFRQINRFHNGRPRRNGLFIGHKWSS